MTSWQKLVDGHAGLVWQTIRQLVDDEADAVDCFQDSFMSAFEAHRLQAVPDWALFLVRVATTRALESLLRRNWRQQRIPADHGRDASPSRPSVTPVPAEVIAWVQGIEACQSL